MPKWTLRPGKTIERKALHATFGGRTQGGIGPSARTPNIFLFSDPVAGERHGYFDGYRDDGCFHYTGEGQRGDQRMVSGNAAILRHLEEGRALRLFLGARGTVQYEGEFQLDPAKPWYTTDAPETGDGPERSVIVFRIKSLDNLPRVGQSRLDGVLDGQQTSEVPVEEQWTERHFVNPNREPYEAERREQGLVLSFRDHLRRLRHDVCRLKILPPGEAKPLFCDLYDRTTGTLIEAKGTVERGAIRMAIGQLADYKRFVDGGAQNLAVLLPDRPRKDLCELLAAEGIELIWPADHGFFEDSTGGRLFSCATH
jgi:hypothetical protein